MYDIGTFRWKQETAALLEHIKDYGKKYATQAAKRGLNSVKWWNFLGSWNPPAEVCAQMWSLWSPWTHDSPIDELLLCRLTGLTIPLNWSDGVSPHQSAGPKREQEIEGKGTVLSIKVLTVNGKIRKFLEMWWEVGISVRETMTLDIRNHAKEHPRRFPTQKESGQLLKRLKWRKNGLSWVPGMSCVAAILIR